MNSEAKQDWRELINSSLPAQREAITSEAALTVVSAGAGTGKTETLAKRVAWLLSSDPECPVEGLLVLTFTEKAAQEMRGRIEGMLKEWYAACPKELAHLKERIAKIEDAQISTIHSFAMKVIRESGLALDLAPDAAIIPEPDERLWWETFAEALDTLDTAGLRAVLEGVWKDRAEELFNSDELRRFITAKGQQGPQTLADAAREAASKLGSCGQTPEELWKHDDSALLKDVESCSSVFEDIWKTWHDDVFPSIHDSDFFVKPDSSFEKLHEIAVSFAQEGKTEENMRVFGARLINEGLRKLPSRSKQKSDLENALGRKLTEWRDEQQPLLFLASRPSEAETRCACLLNRLCALGWHCWDELRRSRGVMSQDDLISYAVEVLKKTPDYGKKFRHIFVDEFQDTDDMQDKLLGLLKNSGNTLFIVGDLKQSIYRFRHAKPENFQRYISQAQNCRDGSCRYVSLSCSFRTRNQLLEKFDEIFKDIWRGGYIEQGKNMRYESISGPDTDGSEWWRIRCLEASEPVVETLIAAAASGLPKEAAGVASSGRESSYYVQYRLFSGLAEKFAALRSGGLKVWDKKAFGDVLKERREIARQGEKLPDWEQETDKLFRPARWRDFAVLVPAKSFYQPLERAFGRAGVPYVLCTSKDYYSRSEVLDAVNLLRLLAEPDDALCMTGWLESPFSGVAPQNVSEYIKEACERRSKSEQMPIAAVLAEKEPQAVERLTELRKTADLCGAAAVVAEISKSQEYLSFFEPEKRCRATANLSHLALLADEYESSQGRSLIGCADYLSGAASDDKAQEEPDVADENEDAVNILTIHASKGLEYPVVALAGTEKGIKTPLGVCVSERYGVVDKAIPDFMLGEGEQADTVRFAWFKKLEAEALTAEKQRLWYVAATRAGEKLFVCGAAWTDKNGVIAAPKAGTFLSHIVKLQEGDSSFCGLTCLKREDWKEFDAQGQHAEEEPTEKAVLNVVSPASLGRLSASAYAMLDWCPTAFRIAFRQGRSLEWALKGGEGAGGSEFGSLAHWALAHWDFRVESLDLWLPEQGEGKLRPPFELKAEFLNAGRRAEVRRLLSDFALSEEGRGFAKLAAAEGLLKRETPFRVQDEDLLLVGATDLMWRQVDSIHIRDWKTTSEDFAPAAYYQAQINFYAYAAWLYSGRSAAVDASLVFLRNPAANAAQPQPFTEELFTGIKNSIHVAATIALSGSFERRTDRCGSCPWRKNCMQKAASLLKNAKTYSK